MYDRDVPIVSPDADPDTDGVPTRNDLCPLVHNNVLGANEDRDGDGVGDLCDPDPDSPHDCLALLDIFSDDAELHPAWKSSGASIMLASGRVRIQGDPETIMYLDLPMAVTTLTIGGYIANADDTGARRAVQILFDHTRDPRITGTACGVEDTTTFRDTSRVTTVDVVDSVDNPRATVPLDDTPIGPGTTVRIGWNDKDDAGDGFPLACRAELSDQQQPPHTVDASLLSAPPQSGTIGIRTLQVGFDLYGIAAYGKFCIAP